MTFTASVSMLRRWVGMRSPDSPVSISHSPRSVQRYPRRYSTKKAFWRRQSFRTSLFRAKKERRVRSMLVGVNLSAERDDCDAERDDCDAERDDWNGDRD